MTAVLSFIDALGRDTLLLTARERDAYVGLIIAYEQQSAPLPDDDVRLALAARLSLRTWRRIRPLIATFFTVGDGLWRHERLDRQLDARAAVRADDDAKAAKAANLSATRSRAAKVRWEKVHAAKLCKTPDLHMQNPPDAHANASAPPVLSSPDELSFALESKRQSIGSQEENKAHAKPAFASKGRKRATTRPPPQPMLRTFSAIPWWLGRERWVDLRFQIGTYEFDRTFGQCRPRDATCTVLVAPSANARDHILRAYGRELTRGNDPPVTVIVEDDVPSLQQGAAVA